MEEKHNKKIFFAVTCILSLTILGFDHILISNPKLLNTEIDQETQAIPFSLSELVRLNALAQSVLATTPYISQYNTSRYATQAQGFARFVIDNLEIAQELLLKAGIADNLELITLLLKIPGIKIDEMYSLKKYDMRGTLLTLAAAEGKIPMIDLLLKAGADINAVFEKRGMRKYPIVMAFLYDHMDAMKRILQDPHFDIENYKNDIKEAINYMNDTQKAKKALETFVQFSAPSAVPFFKLMLLKNEWHETRENADKVAFNTLFKKIDSFIESNKQSKENVGFALSLLEELKTALESEKMSNTLQKEVEDGIEQRIKKIQPNS